MNRGGGHKTSWSQITKTDYVCDQVLVYYHNFHASKETWDILWPEDYIQIGVEADE